MIDYWEYKSLLTGCLFNLRRKINEEYAEILAHDLESNENVQIVDASEAQDIMATDEWSWEEE